MLELNSSKIKGIFALAEIIYEELGYRKENLFGSDYAYDCSDCLILTIHREKFSSSYNWIVELSREEVVQPDNATICSAQELSGLIDLIKKIHIPSEELCLKIFRSRGACNWVAYLGYETEIETLNGYEYFYDDEDEEEDIDVDYSEDDDAPEKAESSTIEGALNRLERIMDLKIK